MSTTSLPSYRATRTPQTAETSAANAECFVKAKNGIALRLVRQGASVTPVYGHAAVVEGTVVLSKPESIVSVEVQIMGTLTLDEVGGNGSSERELCLDKSPLFSGLDHSQCPSSLHFAMTIPTTYVNSGNHCPLPPTYRVDMPGVPGFRACIEYRVSVVVVRESTGVASLFGRSGATVFTPFDYRPRTRPSAPSPSRMHPSYAGFAPDPEWKLFTTTLPGRKGHDILTKLYIPSSRTFCLSQPIPFHLTFNASAFALAAFMPFAPSNFPGKHQQTKIKLIRQVIVDVRNSTIEGTKTDIWRVNTIGEGSFRRVGDGGSWISFSGEIVVKVEDRVASGGFTASGLTVRDYVVLTMDPLEPHKSPFSNLRLVVPICLATDIWTRSISPGRAKPYGFDYTITTTPEEDLLDTTSELGYREFDIGIAL